jgi:hypothetical protein
VYQFAKPSEIYSISRGSVSLARKNSRRISMELPTLLSDFRSFRRAKTIKRRKPLTKKDRESYIYQARVLSLIGAEFLAVKVKCPECHKGISKDSYERQEILEQHAETVTGTWQPIGPSLAESFPQVIPGRPSPHFQRKTTIRYYHKCRKCGNEWSETERKNFMIGRFF